MTAIALPARRATLVGAFVIGALALGVVAIVMFAGRNWFAPQLHAVAYFENSVAGLQVGAPVTLRGVRVGTVRGMKVYLKLPDLVPVIPVFIDIDPAEVSWNGGPVASAESDLAEAVKSGLRAQLTTQSLVTGQVSINLDFHPDIAGHMVGANNGFGPVEIPTIPSDFEHIKNEITELNLPELSQQASAALTAMTTALNELHGKLGPLAESVKQTSDDARATLDTATQAVRDLQATATHTLNSVDQLATTTQGQITRDGDQLSQAVTSLNRLATRAEAVVDNLNQITSTRSQTRGDLEAAVRDLAASASSLRNFSREIEQNPSSLLLGRK